MDEPNISVTLTGPAKVNGVREPTGKTVTVSPTLALQLAASGVINPELAERLSNALDMSDTALEGDFQKAVEDAAAGRIDVLKVEHLLEIETLNETVSTLRNDLIGRTLSLNTALADLQTNEGRLVEERQKVADLEIRLTAEQQAKADAETRLAEAQAELAKLAEQSADKAKPVKTPK
ncbi:hypothetical protein N5C66_00800 [Rhizobium pusense]|uniref:hypothetical protein n=1 Tax=Agrobacterium pusense TaxID=648995 RepID=UPI002449D403|nr:hypothetical protein [Agrobacterium pusense]MDH1093832.1 hypothetical protein [Agrobacterium pusense]MDH1110272.1 hypothetical protein [Agrobacterium pusense]MDH2193714.1 hypothetical protein [Agrobacterium pusense]